MTMSPAGLAPNVPTVAPLPIWSASSWALAALRLMISTVWPCAAARVPMAAAMLPEPMMLMVDMMCVPFAVSCQAGGRSEQSADLVEGLGLTGLLVGPGAAAD